MRYQHSNLQGLVYHIVIWIWLYQLSYRIIGSFGVSLKTALEYNDERSLAVHIDL